MVVGFVGCGPPPVSRSISPYAWNARVGRHDDHEQQRRAEHRHRDRPEPADAAGAVDGRRLVEVARDPLQAGGDEDEREPEVGPHARRAHRPQRGAGVLQPARALHRREQRVEPADVGERTDRRLQQEQPHQARDRDRRGDRRGEDRPEHADAAQVLVGEHGQADAEDQPERHRDQREAERDPERVLELGAAEQVEVLTEALRHAVVAEVVAALLAEPHRPTERVEHEHAEDDRRRRQHRHREREDRPTEIVDGGAAATMPTLLRRADAATAILLGPSSSSVHLQPPMAAPARPTSVASRDRRPTRRHRSTSDDAPGTSPTTGARGRPRCDRARPRRRRDGARTAGRRHVLDRRGDRRTDPRPRPRRRPAPHGGA